MVLGLDSEAERLEMMGLCSRDVWGRREGSIRSGEAAAPPLETALFRGSWFSLIYAFFGDD